MSGGMMDLRNYDTLGRLTETALYSANGADTQSYVYNLGSQRTQQNLTITDGINSIYSDHHFNYAYDNIGQLKTAKGYESGGSSRLHEQFGYAYDGAWNLQYRTNNALLQTFAVNSLNELTSASRSGTLTVAGSVSQGTGPYSVNVSGTGLSYGAATVYSDNTWARAGASPANGQNSYTVTSTDSASHSGSTTVSLNLPTTVTFTYDSQGNLISDGLRHFDYDFEGQLTNVYVTGAWTNAFVYDGLGSRRILKAYGWNGSSWTLTNEIHYVYDGRLVIQERNSANTPLVSYTRGTDLSGSLQGAGGIGGLLARSDSAGHLCYHADGSGNVTALIDSTGNVVARYSYDPFGNLLAMGGLSAAKNLYRFSSKEWQPNSGLYYYGYRFYDANLQRWVNRDPLGDSASLVYQTYTHFSAPVPDDDSETDGIAEAGSTTAWISVNANLSRAFRDDPVDVIDPWGLEDDSIHACARSDPGEVGKIARDLIKESEDFSKKFQHLQQLAKNARKFDVKQLAKRFKVPEDKFHGVKDQILKDFKSEFKKRGLGKNPDVLVDSEGHIVLRTAKGFMKEVWNTGLSVISYCP